MSPNPVTVIPAATPGAAVAHFNLQLSLETDPADVAAALAIGEDPGFVLLDARSAEAFAAGHVPGAYNLDRPFTAGAIASLPAGLIVVYCWGPSCNGATKAAVQLASVGRPVKKMLGGFEYWVREGHPVEGHDELLAEAADNQGLVKLRGAISCLC